MPDVVRAGAIGALMAVVVQACQPTPLGAMVRGAFVVPAYATRSAGVTGIQSNAGSLPHLQNPACQNAACAAR
ncbi:MAG: hypothetical protein RLZZ54_1433 [Cyanobacteriota bacterium]|jgi:hypothetical protein